MDALTLLTADHNRVRGLFKRFKAAHEADDTAEVTELAQQIFTELKVHTQIEEEIFYPRVRKLSDELGELIDEGLQEHHVVTLLMDEAAGIEAGGDEWVAKVQVLIENVEHHAGEEESEMWSQIRAKLDEAALTQLGERLEAGKASLGAPTLADKIDLPKEELMELARKQEIEGRSKMTKEELAATVAPA